MRGISEEFVQQFRQKRLDGDWDLWELRHWMMEQEARLVQDNPGLHYYVSGVVAGVSDSLDTPLKSLICERLYFHFLELIAMVQEHEEVEALEELWGGR